MVHQMRKLRRIGFTMIGFAVLLVILQALDGGLQSMFNGGPEASLASSALVIPLMGLIFVGLPYYSAHQGWKSNPRLADPQDWTVDEASVQILSEFSQVKLPWEKFDRAELLKDLILLYPQQAAAYVIAREYLQDEADWNRLREWCRPKVKKPAFWSGPLKAMVIWMAVLALIFIALRFIPAT
jgi:hypothetical protein